MTVMKTHLAARETFAVDGIPACKARRGFLSEADGGFDATHKIAEVTCLNCRRTSEFQRAVRLGLTENDQTWKTEAQS